MTMMLEAPRITRVIDMKSTDSNYAIYCRARAALHEFTENTVRWAFIGYDALEAQYLRDNPYALPLKHRRTQ